jgi:hypothetical protein
MNPFRNTKTATVTVTSTVTANKTAESHANKQVTYAKLLQQFPKIKFSYELKSYKKVSISNMNVNVNDGADDKDGVVYFIIPKGKKYFVWFKNGECLFLELDNDKQVVNVTSKKTSRIFPNDTILYGTHFYYRAPPPINANSNSIIQYYFTIENIHYYNGVNVDATQTVFEKYKTLHLAFTTVSLEKTFQVDIGLPHIDTCLERISAVKPFYQVYCIQKKKSNDKTNQYQNVHLNAAWTDVKQQPQQQTQEEIKTSVVTVSKHIAVENSKKYVEKSNDYSNNSNNNNNNINNNNKKYKVFIVSADIQNDIYNLVDPDHDDSSNYTIANKLIASIPDYKTSVFMNALFRNIKENRSLDALEESDDEDEFENTNIDKFVDLTKKIKMKCSFNYKFKKWTPVECVN